MSKEIYISSTPHETRLAIVEKDELSEIYYERENEYTLAGSIYNGRVTRVLPGMQSAFVDVGLERDAFLYITDFLEEQGESADFETADSRRGGGERNGRRGERDRSGRERGGRGREEDREVSAHAPALTEEHADAEETEAPGIVTTEQGDEAGAEGSRRWRGRRGRRRGRSGEDRNEAPEQTPTGNDEGVVETQDHADPEVLDSVYGQGQPETETPHAHGREEHGRERGGRERGERGRERGRDRDRDRNADRGRRRESAEAAGHEGNAGAEPLILPGESLSKYRRGDEPGGAAEPSASVKGRAQAANLVTARPSTEVDLSAASWDGGFALPGESLSRHRGRSSEPATGAPTVNENAPVADESEVPADASARDRRRDRDRRRGRAERPEVQAAVEPEQAEAVPSWFRSGAVARESLPAAEAVLPGVSSWHEPEASELPMGEGVLDLNAGAAEGAGATEDVVYEPETDVAPRIGGPGDEVIQAVEELHRVVAAANEPEPAHTVEEFHEETHEYEPGEDASASYRVDPAGPSEFRQSGVTDEDVDAGDPEVQADYAGREHQYTTLEPTGELLSELPGEIAAEVPTEDPTNPIEHETAVLSEEASQILADPSAAAAEGAAVPQPGAENASPQLFAPGEGRLEEELLDDEDETALLDVSASYGDDTEEETFEAGAEIGALARERAIEQITLEGLSIAEDEDDFEIDEEEIEDEDEFEEAEGIAASDIAEAEEDEVLEGDELALEEGGKPAASSMGEFPEFEEAEHREPRQDRDGRQDRGRDPKRGEGRERGGRGNRDRRGMANSRPNGRQSRHSMQNTDLPAISDLLKPGQEVLVQIAKEPIAKKGARITSHIALPGRFLVFMPTVNHVGVSRKIESDGERRRLKEILLSEKGEASGGFIVRTAASGASEEELRNDLRFLLNLWADIKARSESSKSPALIYHDLNLVERILRDQVTDNFSAIWVDTEDSYERVLRFLQRFQPSLMRRVKLYTKDTPLFEQFGISEEINKALRSKVWLKSGGSIVINQTEALVAIDINTGKYVGKTARLEDTIVKTNLDAIPEIVRQIRLRDLGGIIVIDFIDMDDRKNRQKVLTALEEELKNDRAPSKVLQFNDFGLVAITRKRVKQSLERTLSTTCGICAGTGMVKSPITVCNEIYIELRKMHKQLEKPDVMLRVNPEVVKQLKANNGKWLQEMEEISGKTILVKSDPSLHPEQFDIH